MRVALSLRFAATALVAFVASCGNDVMVVEATERPPFELEVRPSRYKFGGVDIGATVTATVSVHNVGREPVAVTLADLSAGPFTFAMAESLVTPVRFGAPLLVTFAPTEPGESTHVLEIRGELRGHEHIVTLDVEGRAF